MAAVQAAKTVRPLVRQRPCVSLVPMPRGSYTGGPQGTPFGRLQSSSGIGPERLHHLTGQELIVTYTDASLMGLGHS